MGCDRQKKSTIYENCLKMSWTHNPPQNYEIFWLLFAKMFGNIYKVKLVMKMGLDMEHLHGWLP